MGHWQPRKIMSSYGGSLNESPCSSPSNKTLLCAVSQGNCWTNRLASGFGTGSWYGSASALSSFLSCFFRIISMSNVDIAGGADQPPVKKLKRGDDEPGTINVGGPMEDEETARKKLEALEFDPDKVNDAKTYGFRPVNEMHLDCWTATPMAHFCRAGDLPMCRYLLSRGASTTKGGFDDDDEWFPMMAAARGGQLDVCKWLYSCGAASDVSRHFLMRDGDSLAPLWYATRSGDKRYFEVGKWLILKGALHGSEGNSNEGEMVIDSNSMVSDMEPRLESRVYAQVPNKQADTRSMYLNWAEKAIIDHKNFFTFLCGASLKAAQYSEELLRVFIAKNLRSAAVANILFEDMPEEKKHRVWNELFVLPLLDGNIGVFQLIADFVGVLRGRELKTVRSLAVNLREFMDDIPEPDSDEESYGDY